MASGTRGEVLSADREVLAEFNDGVRVANYFSLRGVIRISPFQEVPRRNDEVDRSLDITRVALHPSVVVLELRP